MINSFSHIDPSEVVQVSFDFSDGLDGTEIILSTTVVSSVLDGIDAAASSFVKQHTVTGYGVDAVVGNGVEGVTYKIRATITTATKTLILDGKILVRT